MTAPNLDELGAMFPENVCNVLEIAMTNIVQKVQVYRRPLRTTDEPYSVGITAVDWDPDPSSYETSTTAVHSGEPTVQRYVIAVQAMVKDMEESRGIAKHSALSTLVRHMLYRDESLRIALPQTTVSVNGSRETLKRYGITGQQFMNNQNPRGGFIYLSTIEFWFETQFEPI